MISNPKELLFFHGYNHPMLLHNMGNNNLVCVSKVKFQIENRREHQHIYIGPEWENVSFQGNGPIETFSDFYDMMSQVKQKYGGLKKLFTTYPEKIKIFVHHKDAAPFLFFSLFQFESVFKLSKPQMALILKKTNERFWIRDGVKMNLSHQTYEAFKKDFGVIQNHDIYLNNNLDHLPVEYAFLLYSNGNLTAQDLLSKLMSLKNHLLSSSVANFAQKSLEVIFNDPRVLWDFKKVNVDETFDTLTYIESEPFLSQLLMNKERHTDTNWIKKNKDEILNFLKVVKKYDLCLHDPLAEKEEFEYLCEFLFADKPQEALAKLLTGPGIKLHELSFFEENHHSINTTLINHLSVKLQQQENTTPLA